MKNRIQIFFKAGKIVVKAITEISTCVIQLTHSSIVGFELVYNNKVGKSELCKNVEALKLKNGNIVLQTLDHHVQIELEPDKANELKNLLHEVAGEIY